MRVSPEAHAFIFSSKSEQSNPPKVQQLQDAVNETRFQSKAVVSMPTRRNRASRAVLYMAHMVCIGVLGGRN